MRPLRIAIAAAGFAAIGSVAGAADVAPGDYVPAPAGTNLFGFYLKGTSSDELNNTIVDDIPESEFSSVVGLLRFGHYTEVAGLPAVFQGIIPIGGFPDAKVGGVEQPTAEGLGPFTGAFTIWPINTAYAKPYGTSIGLSLYVGTPTGNYDPAKISIGSDTWVFTPQIGIVQSLGGKWYFDGSLDAAIPLDYSAGGNDFSQDPSWQAQAAIRYNVTEKTTASIGYSGAFGGKSYVNGVSTGAETRSDQIRLYSNTWVSPTMQIQGMVGTDVYSQGGFKQSGAAELRIIKLF